MGATRWEVVWGVSFPFARNGIVGAFVIALGRALGETMAVAMTIGGGFRLPTNIMDQGYTLASVIANEFNEVSSETYLSALIYCGLILFVLTVGVNIFAYFIVQETGRYPWLQSLKPQLRPIARRPAKMARHSGLWHHGRGDFAFSWRAFLDPRLPGHSRNRRDQLEFSRQGAGCRWRAGRRHRPVPAGHGDSRDVSPRLSGHRSAWESAYTCPNWQVTLDSPVSRALRSTRSSASRQLSPAFSSTSSWSSRPIRFPRSPVGWRLASL